MGQLGAGECLTADIAERSWTNKEDRGQLVPQVFSVALTLWSHGYMHLLSHDSIPYACDSDYSLALKRCNWFGLTVVIV